MHEKNFIKDIYLMFSLLPFESSQTSTDVHCSTSSDDGVCKCGDTEKEKEQVWSNEKNNKTYKRERDCDEGGMV